MVHMFDEATHYTASSFLVTHSTAEICKTICKICSLTHFGPPDYLVVDQGSAYVSAEFKDMLAVVGIRLLQALIKTSGSIVIS